MLEFLKEAGIVAYPLVLASIVTLGIIIERVYTLNQLQAVENRAFRALQANYAGTGTTFPNEDGIEAAPVTQIIESIKPLAGHDDETLRYAAEISLAGQRQRLRRYLSILATIGSTTPFVGLFGTVLGVMGAFKGMIGGMDSGVMANGISEALAATALGLAVAVPSVIAYNLFLARVQNIMLEIQSHIALLIPLVNRRASGGGGNSNGHGNLSEATAIREDVTLRMPAMQTGGGAR